MSEQKPMGTSDADKAAQASAEGLKNYQDAIKQMTDRNLFDRVAAAHPHASTNAALLKAMVDDYKRLEGERDKAT